MFAVLTCSVILFLLSFFFPWLGLIPTLAFWVLIILFLMDVLLLYRTSNGVFAKRHAPERLSNSDNNDLGVYIENWYGFPISVGIVDEIPFQFQKRDIWFKTNLKPREKKTHQLRIAANTPR